MLNGASTNLGTMRWISRNNIFDLQGSGNLQNGEAFVTARRPKGLRRGLRYLVRLELKDSGSHVARSAYVRLRLR